MGGELIADQRSHLLPAVIGAGPAGLTAANWLVRHGIIPYLIEADANAGGLARTDEKNGWFVDPGGHRFNTKHPIVTDIWRSTLPEREWTTKTRSSAMSIDGKLFAYPLNVWDLAQHLGLKQTSIGLAQILVARVQAVMTRSPTESFRQWGTRTFGNQWFRLFFESYTEKTWLMDAAEISADWAKQRIKPLEWRRRSSRNSDDFCYPKFGPGQLWQAAANKLESNGVELLYGTRVDEIRYSSSETTLELSLSNGTSRLASSLFVSIPLRELIHRLRPEPPDYVIHAARKLTYRHLVTVALPVHRQDDFAFNWLYIPQNHVRVGRIQNYRQWSEHLMPSSWRGTYLGLEYYDSEARQLIDETDDALIQLAISDLNSLGMKPCSFENALVSRSYYAYPLYDRHRANAISTIRSWLHANLRSVYPIGRNGMHRYDNQDHAMLSAIRSVEKYLGSDTDPWAVNTDTSYYGT